MELEPDEMAMRGQVHAAWNKLEILLRAIEVAHRTNMRDYDIALNELRFGFERLVRSIGTRGEAEQIVAPWLRQAE